MNLWPIEHFFPQVRKKVFNWSELTSYKIHILVLLVLFWSIHCIIKLNTKTQNIFCRLNENLMTFLYTLTGPTRKQKEKKEFSLLKCLKSNVIKRKIWVLVFSFMYLVLVDAMDWSFISFLMVCYNNWFSRLYFSTLFTNEKITLTEMTQKWLHGPVCMKPVLLV